MIDLIDLGKRGDTFMIYLSKELNGNRIIILVLLIILYGCSAAPNENEVTVDLSKYDVEVDLYEIAKLNDENPLQYNKAYFGKRLKFSGILEDIETGSFFFGTSFYVKDEDSIIRAWCTNLIDSEIIKLGKLKKGDLITVIGRSEDMKSQLSVSLDECYIYE